MDNINENIKSFKSSEFASINEQVTNHIREKILNGNLPPLCKLPAERNLAVTLGISRVTLRKALNRLNREGLIIKKKNMGNFIVEKNYSSVFRKNLGIVLPVSTGDLDQLNRDYYGVIIEKIRQYMPDAFGLNILNYRKETEFLSMVHNGRLDAIIISAPGKLIEWKLLELGKTGIPFIIIGASFENSGINYVDSDNYEGAKKAVEYLVKLGHRRIGIINGSTNSTNSVDRFKGYCFMLKKNGIKFDKELVVNVEPGELRQEAGYSGAKKLLEQKGSPTALFSAGCSFTLGAIRAIKEKHLVIPKDISVVGFDDFESARYIDPPLTVVRQPLEEMSRIIVEELIKRLNGTFNKPLQLKLKTELVIRESCAKR